MQNTTEKSSRSAEGLYKFFIYFVLVLLAVTIIVPVAWVFMASIKQNAEFYGNPWALPAGFYWQNFVNAWNGAKMGEYMLNSVIVTALALALLLVVALPAAYCLSRFHFKGCKVLNTPLIWTNIRTTLTFFIISTINMAFLFVKAMTSGGPNGASDVALSYMYSQKDAGLYGYSMAIGVVIFLFSFALSACVNKATSRDPLEF